MKRDIGKEQERLSQKNFIAWVTRDVRPADMLTVYLDEKSVDARGPIFSAFITNDRIKECLKHDSWDLRMTEGVPCAMRSWRGDEPPEVRYLRFGNDKGIEPLVI